jgi:SulP family sulfate permease
VLGAIESLLSAVTLDQLTQQRHNSNGELLGQGLGNLAAPLFGGFAASASLSRSLANYSAGASSPVAAVVHALVLVLAILVLAPVLNWLPMPAMAALLLLVAWEISGVKRIRLLFRRDAREERLVFLVCLSLTVLFDMVVAISVGIVMAALMFMQQVAAMTRVTDVSKQRKLIGERPIPTDWKIIKISGPLFFAAADRVFDELLEHSEGCRGMLLYMDAVSVLDSGGLQAMLRFVEHVNHHNIEVLVADLQFQPLKTLVRAQVQPIEGRLAFFSQLSDALPHLHQQHRTTQQL